MNITPLVHQILLRDAQAAGDRRQWLPVLPAGTLKALKTPDGPKSVEVQESYLRLAVSEFKRYIADLNQFGLRYHRPILVEHVRSGRRQGDLLDAEVRLYDTGNGPKPTLFLLANWREDAWDAIQKKSLEHVSVRIDPEYVDPQTSIRYSPFIVELSETVTPVIKDFRVQDTLDPAALEGLGLRLSETPANGSEMTKEEIEAMIKAALEERDTVLDAKLKTFGDTLVAQLKPEPPEGDPADPPTQVQASDINVDDLVAKFAEVVDVKLQKQAEDFDAKLADQQKVETKVAAALAAAQGVKLSEPGNGSAPTTEPEPPTQMSEDQALALAEKYFGGHDEVEAKIESGALDSAKLINTAEQIRKGDLTVA